MSQSTDIHQAVWEEPLREAMHAHADGDYEKAEQCYRAILAEFPTLSRVAYNLANILKYGRKYKEAELFFRQALSAEPELFEAAQNLAFVLQEQGRIEEAINQYQSVMERWPGLPDPRFSLACLQLLTGLFDEGWDGYEARFDCIVHPVPRRHLEIPLWNGTLTCGLRLLVHTEQGYGDTIQMCRYLPLLISADIQVVLETDPALVPLLSRMRGLKACLARGTALPPVDSQTPLMSLPRVFGTRLETIPTPSFPDVDQILSHQIEALLPALDKTRIGLCWSGRLDLPVNRKRSCPPELIRTLLETPDCSFISLQRDSDAEHRLSDIRLLDITGRLQDFHDTAALINSIDLVITIDTSIAHLAASLGKPTWLLLPHVPDWRWLLDREDSPWYPTIRIFRQPAPDEWLPVIRRVRIELAKLDASPAQALTNLGAAFDNLGDHTMALECYHEALDRNAGIAITHYNMGNSLSALGRSSEAMAAWQHALDLNPAIVEAWHNLSIYYRDRCEPDKAHAMIRAALRLRPDCPELFHTQGELFQAEEQFDCAIASFRQSLEIKPDSARTWNSLGVVFQCAEDDRSAEVCYRNALKHDPNHLHAANNLGAVLLTLSRTDESIEVLRQLVAKVPEYHDGHWNLACSLLASGDWEQGWAEFEYRFLKHSPVQETHPAIPRWQGESLAGKRILLTAEQAFGDTIQFIRFAPLLAAMDATVILECQAAPIARLMSDVAGIAQVICRGNAVPAADYRLPLMSLPYLLGITSDAAGVSVPYLKPQQAGREKWQQLLSQDNGLRVGLCWWGRQTLRNRRRSCPPELLAPLATLENVTLYRLQVGIDAPQPPFTLTDYTGLINDFADTADLISCLDLVITIDTAVAHLAGALGSPVWLMLPETGDWRWMTGKDNSPWYPTMRIFKRPAAEGWGRTIEVMADLLARLASPAVYICKPDTDFKMVPHLAERLVPFLDRNCNPATTFSVSTDKKQADLILFPYYLENLTEWVTIEGLWAFLEQLPLFDSHEDRYILFSDHDSPVSYISSAWWFRASTAAYEQDPNTLALPYQTRDHGEYPSFALESLRYHASFTGYLGLKNQRGRLLEGFTTRPELHVLIEATEAFYGHLPPDKQLERRQRFLEIVSQSLCILCPAGDGSNSLRFYETLRLGRLPVLISDCPLPFETEIPYHRFVCRISPSIAHRGGELLLSWLSELGDYDVAERCKEARRIWELWFSPEAMPTRLWTALIRKRCRTFAIPAFTPEKASGRQTCLTSRSPLTYLQQGRDAADRGSLAEAETAYTRAIGYNQRCYPAYLELGRLLSSTGRDSEAVERYYEASIICPDDPAPYRAAIPCLERLGRVKELDYCRAQLTGCSTPPPPAVSTPVASLMDLADSLREQEQWEEALNCYRQVLLHKPDYGLPLLRAGGCLILLNRHDEAIPFLQSAATLLPEDPDPHTNLAICHLALRRWQEGWEEFEWRRKSIADPLPPIPELPSVAPEFRLDSKTVLVHCEQGFGDMLQFCRYIPLLSNLGAHVIFSVPDQLARLFESLDGQPEIVRHGELLPTADFQTLLMSLPRLLMRILPAPLNAVPYLTHPAYLAEQWRSLLATLPGIRVGIAWQGRDMRKSGYRRSLTLENLEPLLEIGGCSFVSLQPDQPVQHPRVLDCSGAISDFADTAALMQHLDLVITIDTAVAHLAGALGIPCWLALLYSPDWRWFPLNTPENCWYPTLRRYQQDSPGDWDSVLSRLVASLQEELLTRKGNLSLSKGDEETALDCFRQATAHRDATPQSWLNLGNTLHLQGKCVEAVTVLKHAVALAPGYPEAWQNLGLLHQANGELPEAYTCFRKALQLRPDYPTARWNLSLLQLLLGEYREGFKNYEARFRKQPPVPQRYTELPLWNGSPLAGKRLLVHAEQGYGDTIQFCRYLPLLSGAVASVIFEVQDSSLSRLMSTLSCPCTVISRGDEAPYVDIQVPLMSLPLRFDTTPDSIPHAIPYLSADPALAAEWHNRLKCCAAYKIGIAWQGSKRHINDRFRSCPPEVLLPLAELPDIAWYQLQPETPANVPGMLQLVNMTEHIRDFSDTAALIANLDLVISVDTAVAHLAGATGKPVWLLLPYAPDWRWGVSSDTTPWYPDMKLFRQTTPGDWVGVVKRVAVTLSDMLELIETKRGNLCR